MRLGVFRLGQPARVVAKAILATLEGAMIAARTFDDERRLMQAARWLLATVDAGSGSRAGNKDSFARNVTGEARPFGLMDGGR